jgi:HAD superfamily hydrolase (TIGR01459 family)
MHSLSSQYPVWFCDVWGVIHDGVDAFATACNALMRHRANGGRVLLVTNAPRRADDVMQQLTRLHVPAESYDAVITSGDVTRDLIATLGRGAVHHIGPPRDLGLFAGLETTLVPLEQAHAVVCTGLFDDTTETPDDYRETYRHMRELGLAMICANPDKIVRRGPDIVYCAGALAEQYEAAGGTVHMAGKPFAPIYDYGFRIASDLMGTTVLRSQILAIGDGPETDIAGAAANGLDCVLITGGISDATLSSEAIAREVRAQVPAARIVKVLPELAW